MSGVITIFDALNNDRWNPHTNPYNISVTQQRFLGTCAGTSTRPSSRPVHKDGKLKEAKRLGIKNAGTKPIFIRSFPKKDPFTITVDFLEVFNRTLLYTLWNERYTLRYWGRIYSEVSI